MRIHLKHRKAFPHSFNSMRIKTYEKWEVFPSGKLVSIWIYIRIYLFAALQKEIVFPKNILGMRLWESRIQSNATMLLQIYSLSIVQISMTARKHLFTWVCIVCWRSADISNSIECCLVKLNTLAVMFIACTCIHLEMTIRAIIIIIIYKRIQKTISKSFRWNTQNRNPFY